MKLTRFHCKARRDERRAEALARADARAKRTHEEQLALIAKRPGDSRRESLRIAALNGIGSVRP